MGTTKDSIENGDNPVLAFVLAIEGEVTLITSWADTAAVVTAWAATAFAAASAGLETPGEIAQSLSPFRPSIESDSTTFVIHGGEDDTFAESVFAKDKTGGLHAKVTTSADADDTSIVTSSATGFDASGSAYLGTERFTYGSITGSTYNVTARGSPAPFAIDGGTTWGRAHRKSQVAGSPVQFPYVTDYPRKWVGKWIGCWVHRVSDAGSSPNVLDTKAEAQLIFAGKIADISDGVSNGQDVTVLTCTDTREAVKSAVLLGDQWSATPQDGVDLQGGTITLRTQEVDLTVPTVTNASETLTVGETKYGNVHIATGRRTWLEIVTGLALFISDAVAAGDLVGTWAAGILNNRFRVRYTTAANANRAYMSMELGYEFAGMLGFDVENPDDYSDDPSSVAIPSWESSRDASPVALITVALFASFSPARTMAMPHYINFARTMLMQDVTGTWIDQQAELPIPYADMTTSPDTSSGNWGFMVIGERTALAEQVSASEYKLWVFPELDDLFGFERVADLNSGPQNNDSFLRLEDPPTRYKQIILIRKDFDYIINRIFASTGASTYNHATYDAWDYQLSADGGIPWDLLGSNFIATTAHLAGLASTSTMTLLLDEPTKLEEILLPELALRNAHLMLKDGALVFVTPTSPASGSTTHAITTSHKAADPDSAAADWPDHQLSRDTVITHIKVKYNRTIDGRYRNEVSISNEQSKSDHGTSEPITIEARNSIDIGDGAGDVVSDLINALGADALAYYGRPLPIASRSLSFDKFFVTPGLDTVSVTDSFLRSVSTGQRGLTAIPAWAIGLVQDWTTRRGTIQMVLLDEDNTRRVIYSPAGLIDITKDGGAWDKGYNAGTSSIWLVSNTFSLAAEDDDVTHIDDGDLLTVIERSPATPGSPVKWDRTVSSTSGNDVVFSSGLSSPAWDNTLQYYVVSQDRSTAQTTQQADCYAGDDVDGKIADDVRNRIWTNQAAETQTVAAAVQTDRHEYPPTDGEYWTEDQPVHPAMHRNVISTGNNLIGYRTAPQMIMALDLNNKVSTTSTSYVACVFPFKYYLGRGRFTSLRRTITLGPAMQQTTAGTGSIRVTLSALPPESDDAIGAAIALTFVGVYIQMEFTNTTTANIVNVAAQTKNVVAAPSHEYTWVTVEHKTSANTSTFLGFHEFFLGPLT